MTEKDLVKAFIAALKKRDIPYIHLPNSLFKGYANRNLKDIPDYIFPFNGKIYLVELGINGRNVARKKRQLDMMRRWQQMGGCEIQVLTTLDQIELFWKVLDQQKKLYKKMEV